MQLIQWLLKRLLLPIDWSLMLIHWLLLLIVVAHSLAAAACC
jgi:hypothetical protein